LILARQLRGARRFGPEVLAQLLVRTTERAERVDLAMRLRGASGTEQSGFDLGGVALLLGALFVAVALHLLGRSGP
jgi:energy-coupling factor transporter transmembrane protein EcfT